MKAASTATLSVVLGLCFFLNAIGSYCCAQEKENNLSGGAQMPSQGEMISWRLYQNDKFGFDIKYRTDWRIVEYQPNPNDSYLTKIYIPHHLGGFAAEIQVFENKDHGVGYGLLKALIMKWYGVSETFSLPLKEARDYELSISSQPAIRIDYIELTENPSSRDEASLLFVANPHFIYRLACCCDSAACDQVISTFKLQGSSLNPH